MSNWLVTAVGREHELTGQAATHPDNVPSLREIGHSLAQINRFTGHAKRPYSVAEHSLLVYLFAVADGASNAVRLAALMHDAHECITNDLASPIKAELGDVWAAFEWKHQRHLLEQYELLDVYTEHKAAIKRWDLLALAAERQHVVAYNPETNRPWPVLDTEGAEVFAPPIDLNSTWRLQNTWETWADLFQLRADQLMKLVQFGQAEELAA